MSNSYACVFLFLILLNSNWLFFSAAVLFSLGSVQEMTQMQIKLQQAQSAKTLSENMNKVLQVCPVLFCPRIEPFSEHYSKKMCLNLVDFKLFIFYFYCEGGSGWFEGADHSVWVCCETWCYCIRPDQWLGEPAVWILYGFRIKENKPEKWHASQVHHDYKAELLVS